MKKSFASSVAMTAILASFTASSFAAPAFTGTEPRQAVLSKDGINGTKPVISVVQGTNEEKCVLTKWEGNNSYCFEEEIVAPEPVVAVPVVIAPTPPKQTTLSKYQRSYIVFFDFDKSSLTSDAVNVIGNLQQAVSGTKNNVYQLVGHTDSSGSNKYNAKLSQKRANAVKSKMVSMGIPAESISANWKGESSLLVPTKDGIKEPQNRRVEIQVQYYK